MSKYTIDDWLQYVNGTIQEKNEREMEHHLYECDQCLALYMDAVEQNQQPVEELTDETFVRDVVERIKLSQTDESVESRVITHLQRPTQAQEAVSAQTEEKAAATDRVTALASKKSKKKINQTLLHYGLAASLTFALMATGIFEEIAFAVNEGEQAFKQVEEATFSQKMLDQVSNVIERLTSAERGEKNE